MIFSEFGNLLSVLLDFLFLEIFISKVEGIFEGWVVIEYFEF